MDYTLKHNYNISILIVLPQKLRFCANSSRCEVLHFFSDDINEVKKFCTHDKIKHTQRLLF